MHHVITMSQSCGSVLYGSHIVFAHTRPPPHPPTHPHTPTHTHREELHLEAQKLRRELRTAKRRKEKEEDEKAQQVKIELESNELDIY